MTTPIEQRKDLFEISTDLNLMITYRKAIMDRIPRSWVIIHKNQQNYGLEVMNSLGNACTTEEAEEIKQILFDCRNHITPAPAPVAKKSRKKKEAVPS